MIYVGVDPGAEGGIASVGDVVGAWALPMNEHREPDHAAILRFFGRKRPVVVIEEQFLIPRHAGEKEKLTNFGIILGLFLSFAKKIHRVTWNEWQPFMAPGVPRGDARKAFLIQRARFLFPALGIQKSGPADAILLAEFGRLTR